MKGKRKGFGNIRCLKIVPGPNPRKQLASQYATVGFYLNKVQAIELATSLLNAARKYPTVDVTAWRKRLIVSVSSPTSAK